ncbi:DUF5641 domain-containing protein [Trichonephila clavipes]|nr:DUF5641 domain-containing protein [Trichonephila clavipes]
MGLLGPVIDTANIFMKNIWLVKRDWDQPLLEDEIRKWRKFVFSLRNAENPHSKGTGPLTSELTDAEQFLIRKAQARKFSEDFKRLERSISWKFIPPRSPNFGGLWESCVKFVKYHLRRVVGNARLTYEELSTALAQIEAVLKSRPISPLSSDPNDYQDLTPGHFFNCASFVRHS